MIYIKTYSTDPAFNLALEQYVFDFMDRNEEYCMLWQNENSVIVGYYQNTRREINASFVREQNIKVIRRLSGGGAVFHDLGNLNYTFIGEQNERNRIDFVKFCSLIVDVLAEMGVKAEISGRNDITIEGKKVSGNAQYFRKGRVMHHGTLLFDSDLTILSQVLNVPKDKIESKGIKSVASRVANIRSFLKRDMSLKEFWRTIEMFLAQNGKWEEYELTDEDLAVVKKIKLARYDQWDWNYGKSPDYNVFKERRVDGFGKIEVYLKVEKGIITSVSLHGDFFGSSDLQKLCKTLIGHRLEYKELRQTLEEEALEGILYNLGTADLVNILVE